MVINAVSEYFFKSLALDEVSENCQNLFVRSCLPEGIWLKVKVALKGKEQSMN